MDEEQAPTPEESRAIIDAQRRQVHARVYPDDRLLYGMWGLAWGLGYQAMFFDSSEIGQPGPVGGSIFAGLMILAAVATIVHSERRTQGLGGTGGTMTARLGASWGVAFGASFFAFGGTFRFGVDGPGVAVMTNALPCLIVACLFMGAGAAWDDGRQFRLGVWIAAITAVASIVGPPHHYLVMSGLGGGGFLVAALRAHLERKRDG